MPLKVHDLKLLCPSQLCGLKDQKISRILKWKIVDGIENVPKISTRRLAINTEFLFAFYKSNLVAL